MGETISQLTSASKANLTDIFPSTQGSVGPGTGATRGVTLQQILAPTSADSQSSVTILPFQKSAAFVADSAQIFSQYNTNASGGTSGNVVSNGRFYTSIYGAPNAFLWTLLGVADYDGTGGTGQHVAVYGQALRRTYAAGGSGNNPQIWAATFESRDLTNQPSSVPGAAQLGVEIDILANGLDDANVRQGLAIIVGKAQSGAAAFAGTGLGLYSADGTSGYGHGIFMGFPFTIAGMDFRSATKTSGHSIWFGTGHDLALDTGGTTTLYYDPSAFSATGGARLSGKLQVDGQLYTPGIEVVGGLITGAAGASFSGAPVTIDGNTNLRLTSQTSGAGVQVGTLNNAPVAGDPGFWLSVYINSVPCHIPVWIG